MLSNTFLKSLRDLRRSIGWWALGLFLYTVLIVLMFPSFQDMPELNEILGEEDSILRAFAGNVEDFSSPEGFLTAETFSLMLPMIFIVFSLSLGSSWLAGEERRGSLEVMLSHPIRRSSVLLQKFGAIVTANAVLGVVVLAATVVGIVAVDMDISVFNVVQACVSLVIFGSAFAALAVFLSGWTGKSSITLGAGAAVGIVGYLANTFAPIVDAISWAQYLSPIYYYIGGDPLTNGLNLVHAGVLVAASAIMVALASYLFERRDLGV
jgi:ABC-2 type transport system permease protein